MEKNAPQRIPWYAWAAGLLAGGLEYVAVTGFAGSVLLPFLPFVPLLAAGLRGGVYNLAVASTLACIVVLVGAGVDIALFFFFTGVVPTCLFGAQLLSLRLKPGEGIAWLPVGRAISGLTLYLALFAAAVLLAYEKDAGALLATFLDSASQTENLDPAMRLRVEEALTEKPYIFFALVVWISVLMFYAAALFAHFICASYGMAARASLRLAPFTPPTLLLVLLILLGALGMMTEPPRQTAWHTAFLALLLPYFLAGMAMIHEISRSWKMRGMWLATLYLVIIVGVWPVGPIAAYGLYRHIAALAASAGGKK